MGRKILVLEDTHERIREFDRIFSDQEGIDTLCYAQSVAQAILYFNSDGPFTEYYLDYDLGGEVFVDGEEEDTGYQFALFLANKGITGKNETIIIHSWNPVGARRMNRVLPYAIQQPLTA